MIGVDIIDLSYPIPPRHTLDAYKKKILNPAEYAFCEDQLALYCIWAIKESTYKCYYKNGGAPFLNPKKIRLTFIDFAAGHFMTEVDENMYSGELNVQDDHVYAVCTSPGLTILPEDIFVRKNTPVTHPEDELPFFFKGASNEARYQFHADGFPLGIAVEQMFYAYSRSHHGNYYISVIGPGRDN